MDSPRSTKANNPPRLKHIAYWVIALTLVFELLTIGIRVLSGMSASEFNRSNPPLLLQIHHMFWAVPFLIVLP